MLKSLSMKKEQWPHLKYARILIISRKNTTSEQLRLVVCRTCGMVLLKPQTFDIHVFGFRERLEYENMPVRSPAVVIGIHAL